MEPVFEQRSVEVLVRVCGPSFLLLWFRDSWLRNGSWEIGEFHTFKHFPCSWYLPCSRTKKFLSLGELIYGVFDTIVYMFFNLYSMFYRVSPVLLESFQVWSRLKSWRKKYEERSKNWSLSPRSNQAEQSDGWSHQEQTGDCSRHLWQFPYLSKIYPNHLFSPLMSMAPPYKKPSLSLFFLFLREFCKKTKTYYWICYCKGDGSSSSPRRFLFRFICSIIQLLCLVHLVLWLSSRLAHLGF